jgi:hypothetical protein
MSNVSAQAKSVALRFLSNTAFRKIRQARLVNVLSEGQLLKETVFGAHRLLALITVIISLYCVLVALLYTAGQHEKRTLNLLSK